MTDQTAADFDGCRRDCRQARAHTLVWGECEHAPEPEPAASLPRAYTAADGLPAIGFDTYTVTQLAELIEPALRTIKISLGPNALAMLERGETVRLSVGEYVSLALAAADAIVHRNEPPAAATVLPPVSRADVLREAADRYAALVDQNEAYELAEHGSIDHESRLQFEAVRDVATGLRRMADEEQPATETQARPRCTCPHPVDEHSVYGCADECACQWLPKRRGVGVRQAATVDPAVCPRCKGDNREAFELCPARATVVAEQPAAADTDVPVHACPGPDDNGISPCCRRPPFEFRGERLTRDPDKVTCPGLPT